MIGPECPSILFVCILGIRGMSEVMRSLTVSWGPVGTHLNALMAMYSSTIIILYHKAIKIHVLLG